MTRRGFFERGVWLVGGIFSALLGIPLIGYFGSELFTRTSEQWVRVCSLDQINPLTPTEFKVAFKGENATEAYETVQGVFVIRKGADILAFTNVCTHMHCPVRWLAWRQEILCPCHGGTYDRWGDLMGGPPAASLPLYNTRIVGTDVYVSNRMRERV